MFILGPPRIALRAIVLQICLLTAYPALAVDLPPQVDLNGAAAGANASAIFTEDAGAVDLCPNATVTDDGSISAIMLTVTPHPEGMDEFLSAVPLAGLAITYNRGNGEMLINGTGSAAIYQQVLRTLRYLNYSNSPTPATRVVTVVAYDANTFSTPRTIQITVAPVNDAPVVDLNGSAAGVNRSMTFTEGGGAVSIAPAALVTDPDSTQITSMTLKLSPNPNGGNENLNAAAGGGVSVSYDVPTGMLMLTGTALIVSYQAVLRTVTYNNTAAIPDPTTRTLTVTAWDSNRAAGWATASIGIVQANRAPTGIDPATMSIAENSAVGTVVGTLSAIDPDYGDTHTFVYALPYANGGKFSISGNAIKVASAIDHETTESVTVTVKATDKGGLSYTRDIVVTILDVNETPTNIQLAANALLKTEIANETVAGTLSATDPDAGQTLTYTFTSPGNNCGGRFKIAGNQLRIANATQIKADTQVDYAVSVRVTDQGGLTSTKNFTIHIAKANAAGHWRVYR